MPFLVTKPDGAPGAAVLAFPAVTKPTSSDLPNRVREWRDRRGMTLRELAEAPGVGIHYAHLSKIELGQRELGQVSAERLAAALGVPTADLQPLDHGGLTERERFLIETYRQVPEGMRAAFDALAESQQVHRGEPEVVPLQKTA